MKLLWGEVSMGGGYLPHIINSSLVDLHYSSELFAEHNGFSSARNEFYCPTARRFGNHRPVRGCQTLLFQFVVRDYEDFLSLNKFFIGVNFLLQTARGCQ
jgi:hypothetical protein